MKRIITTFAVLLIPIVVTAQVAVRQKFPKTDLEWNNIKGPVVSIRTQNVSFRKAYGEWTSTGVNNVESKYEVYGTNGNLLMNIEWNSVPYPYLLRIFHYDTTGTLTGTDIYDFGYWDNSWPWPKVVEKYKKDIQESGYNDDVYHSEYQYKDGRLMNIITRRERRGDWRSDDGARDIFRYNDDDSFTMTSYDGGGREEESFMISADGHEEINRKQGFVYIRKRDDEGKVTAELSGVSAINGRATRESYYGYNENGDILIQSSSEEVIQDLDELPWLKRIDDYGRIIHFEYEYDSHGNWINRKCFIYQSGDEPSLREWKKRTIVYVDDIGMTGEELIEKELQEAAEKEALRNNHPYVTFDGNLGETILKEVMSKLPKVSMADALKGEEGQVTIIMKVSGDGVVENIYRDYTEEYMNEGERGRLIFDEVKVAAQQLSGTSKWIKGYEGATFYVLYEYYSTGRVVLLSSEVGKYE